MSSDLMRRYIDILNENKQPQQLDEGVTSTIMSSALNLISKLESIPVFAQALEKAKNNVPLDKMFDIAMSSRSPKDLKSKVQSMVSGSQAIQEDGWLPQFYNADSAKQFQTMHKKDAIKKLLQGAGATVIASLVTWVAKAQTSIFSNLDHDLEFYKNLITLNRPAGLSSEQMVEYITQQGGTVAGLICLTVIIGYWLMAYYLLSEAYRTYGASKQAGDEAKRMSASPESPETT